MELIVNETIETKIYEIRGMKVMLDSDLARLYQVETRVLNQAVKRNMERFPYDFLTESASTRCFNWKIMNLKT